MNFYTTAARINARIDKAVRLARDAGQQDLDIWEQTTRAVEMRRARKNMELGIDLMLMYKEIATEKGILADASKNYFVTIRPDTNLITFNAFFTLIQKLVRRTCFITYSLSFEQKGESNDTLGHGFHVHIIAHMKQRSKTEVLRDVQSTVKHCTTPNNVDVAICKNPQQLKQGYLLDYESADGHKAPTKEWDALWRTQEGLLPIYEDSLPARLVPLA